MPIKYILTAEIEDASKTEGKGFEKKQFSAWVGLLCDDNKEHHKRVKWDFVLFNGVISHGGNIWFEPLDENRQVTHITLSETEDGNPYITQKLVCPLQTSKLYWMSFNHNHIKISVSSTDVESSVMISSGWPQDY